MPLNRLLLPIALASALATPLSAEDVALLVGNARYDRLDEMTGGGAVSEATDALRDAGLQVEVLRDADRRSIGDALRRIENRDDVENLMVALSGWFVHSASETWFLPVDAEGRSIAGASLDAVPLSSVMEILDAAPGRAVLFLGTLLDRDGASGSLTRGIGTLDIPEDVVVIEGWPKAVPAITSDTLARPGASLRDRLRDTTDWARARGDLDPDWAFLSDGESAAPEPVPLADAPPGERAFWQRARDGDTEESYIAYLDAYPSGVFAAEATQRLKEVREGPNRAARIVEDNLELDREARRQIQRDLVRLGYDTRGVDGIFGPGTRRAIGNWQDDNGRARSGYLDRGMIDRIEEQARARADAEAADEERFWAETGQGADEAGLIRFLERYPDGRYADRAERRLREIRDGRLTESGVSRREEVLWTQAQQSGTIAAYEDYARAFPRGRHADEARAQLAALRSQGGDADGGTNPAEEALGLNQLTRRTVEERLATEGFDPGPVDGNFDAQTRRAIRSYQDSAQLPVTGYLDETVIVRLLADTVRRALSR